MAPQPAALTVRAAWQAAKATLLPVSDSAALDAQLLLSDVLGVENRAYLYAHPEQELSPAQAEAYAAQVARRAQGEPVAYIRGFKAWYDRDIYVSPAVLIPRPETELLLEAALDFARARATLTAADICTGSGAIAVTLKANAPHAHVYATDLSVPALEVAALNARTAAVDVQFLQGDLLAPLLALSPSPRLDLLISNPPYIATDELAALEVARHEPALALDGGADGLALVRRLLADVPRVCASGALVLVEIGATQGAATLALAHELLQPAHAEIVKDYAGLDRFLRAILRD